MRDCHALDAPIECLDKFVIVLLPWAYNGDHGDARERS